jgi:hypothetical protein
MNAVKCTYIIRSFIFELAMLALAVAAPIWLTPGKYWWTLFAIIASVGQSRAFSDRLNSWKDMGKV